ncbi:HAD-IIB family hydrolase [Rummeliibacillus sp. NPDC094406]|uniref:HAD-IIB family hydrolase n=1 Tax=Rummeliibacillus sp. NPDC094406 TaxID=3364511 RepID=UPI00382883FA
MQFIFDLDGTICFGGKPVAESILYSLENLTEKGHEVIFASARPIRDMLPVLHKRFHGYKMIGGNGSLMCKNGNVKQNAEFDVITLEHIKRLMAEYHATYLIDSEWDYSYTGSADHPILKKLDIKKLAVNRPLEKLEHVVKIAILTSYNMVGLRKKLEKLDVIIHTHHQEGMLDISPCGIHKWSALQKLGVRKGKYIAFGNDANDVTMFENAQHSVMIGQHPLLAHYADESIEDDTLIEENIIEKLAELDKRFAY